MRVAAAAVVLLCLGAVPAVHAVCPHFAAPVSTAVGNAPSGIAAGDFNLDGRPDLAIANTDSNSVSILLANGAGSFSPAVNIAVGTQPVSVATGDFTRDGRLDLAVANRGSGNVTILSGNGLGGFSLLGTHTTQALATSVATADLDRDGNLDLAVANRSANNISILLGNGFGGFGSPSNFATSGESPQSVTTGDLDRDGDLDLIAVNRLSDEVAILLGNGAGSFGAASLIAIPGSSFPATPMSVAVGDFNRDGKLDLATANSGTATVSILIGQGTGGFAAPVQIPTLGDIYAVVAADFTGDGDTDVAVSSQVSSLASILEGNGTGGFSSGVEFATGSRPAAMATADFNGDGKPDLATADQIGNTASVLLNNSACVANCGTFGIAATFNAASGPSSAAAADFNRDGRVDLAITNEVSGSVSILLATGDGTFDTPVDHFVGAYPLSVAAGDFNRDGKPDLAVANSLSDNVSMLFGDGAGGFGTPSTLSVGDEPRSITAGDFNGDGATDLAVSCGTADEISLLRNTTSPGSGSASFVYSAISSIGSLGGPRRITSSDFNRDGRLDLAVATFGDALTDGNIRVFFGAGNMIFSTGPTITAGRGTEGVAAGDVNGDGWPDLVATNSSGLSVSVALNNGSGFFGGAALHSAGSSPVAVVALDLTHDGKIDLAVANRNSNNVSILAGNGTGGFSSLPSPGTGSSPSAIVAADFIRDGKPDLAVPNWSNSNVSIIPNTCPPPDLTVSKTHFPTFAQGGTGTYSISVSNVGSVPAEGLVKVKDVLPAGLTATSMSGSGWTCTLAAVTCTRSDSLGAGNTYPPINLEVNVASNSPLSLVNTVTVEGGGDATPGNNSATDPTTVTARADVTVSKTHSGNFAQGQQGATYTITVSNIGGLATFGVVTVNDTLPAGLTAATMGGTGWSCTLGTRTCTRSDALGSGASYPPITLTVNVAANAAASVNNTATVSGGSQTYTANDTATDPTTITQHPDLTVVKSHLGNFTQGQTGRMYSILVSNGGGAATSGTVTVTDTLPPGLTATSLFGNGWSCTLGTLTCTRASALAGGASYPRITLIVNVALNAVSGTNTATVSGGGEVVTSNNTSADPTTINARTPACGRFVAPVNYGGGQGPHEIAVADFTDDGIFDLAVSNVLSHSVDIHPGVGDGTFGPGPGLFGVANNPYSLAAGDFNSDGKADLAVANMGTDNVTILLRTGSMTFATPVYYAVGIDPFSVVVGEFNGDGILDLAVTQQAGISLLLGNGNGTFAAATTIIPGSGHIDRLVTADFNGDGKMDLAATKIGFGYVNVLLGNGTGGFVSSVDYAVGTQPYAVAAGDLNGDGRPDLAVANMNNFATVVINNGDGTFGAPVSYAAGTQPVSVAIADFNADGTQDVVVANSSSNNVSVFLGNGNGTLRAAVAYAAASAPSSVTTGDFDGDGRPDLAVSNFGANNVSILRAGCPDLIVNKIHSGNFTQGQTDAVYMVNVANNGTLPTTGTITVTEVPGTGLVVTAMSGSGWTCALASLTCTRTDTFEPMTEYTPVFVTVTVASNAASSTQNTVTVSGGGEANTGNNTFSDPTTVTVNPDAVPTRLTATASSLSQINVSWDPVSGATGYQLFRKSHGGGYVLLTTVPGTSLPDTVAANTTYVYRVHAVKSGGAVSGPSVADLATTYFFADSPAVAGLTVKALHHTELRTAVDAVRTAAGLAAGSYTNVVAAGSLIRAVDTSELRANLDAARSLLGVPGLAYTDSVLGGATVKAVHIQELRSGTQ